MIEGLWTMQYISGRGTLGTAVVVFTGGRVYGGDANYYLAGEYRLDGDVDRKSTRLNSSH